MVSISTKDTSLFDTIFLIWWQIVETTEKAAEQGARIERRITRFLSSEVTRRRQFSLFVVPIYVLDWSTRRRSVNPPRFKCPTYPLFPITNARSTLSSQRLCSFQHSPVLVQ